MRRPDVGRRSPRAAGRGERQRGTRRWRACRSRTAWRRGRPAAHAASVALWDGRGRPAADGRARGPRVCAPTNCQPRASCAARWTCSSHARRASSAACASAILRASPGSLGLGEVGLEAGDRLLELRGRTLGACARLGVGALPLRLVGVPHRGLDRAQPGLDPLDVAARDLSGRLPAVLDPAQRLLGRRQVGDGSSFSASASSASLTSRFARNSSSVAADCGVASGEERVLRGAETCPQGVVVRAAGASRRPSTGP